MIARELLYDMLNEDAFLIPEADRAICGLTPQGFPIYNYEKLIEHYIEEFLGSCDNPDEAENMRVSAVEWVESTIACELDGPIIMYQVGS